LSFVNGFQRTAVFISGSGSCLQALLDLSEFQNMSLIITNKKSALGVLRARRFGVEVLVMNSQMNFDQIHLILKTKRIQKIFLAGFMKIIPEAFLSLWTNHIFNIHPSLLPQFKGLHGFESAFDSNADIGVTIHHVTSEMDAGEIVLQQVSSKGNEGFQKPAAQIFLRRTEQNLIREFTYKGSVLCTRF
jgi:folate-dependent phosphoribosylglycinamide formyltransferase PurN